MVLIDKMMMDDNHNDSTGSNTSSGGWDTKMDENHTDTSSPTSSGGRDMSAIVDMLSDDLLSEVLSFLPSGSFLPMAHVCKAFGRGWLLLEDKETEKQWQKCRHNIIPGHNDNHNKVLRVEHKRIVSTNPFKVGQLYLYDWSHPCYYFDNKVDVDVPSQTGTLNIQLLAYFIRQRWLLQYRSLRRRKLMTKILIMAAQRGDIPGMHYMLFELEPLELRDRLQSHYTWNHREAAAAEAEGNRNIGNVTQATQELCLQMAAAGQLQALHWLLTKALQVTWRNDRDAQAVHEEAVENDHSHVAQYMLLTMTANFTPSQTQKQAAHAQLQSIMNGHGRESFTTNTMEKR
jgi:hypothetical protein